MSLEMNKNIAKIFKDFSIMYKYLGGDNRFRAIAYSKASKVIDAMQEDIVDFKKKKSLKDIPGIGDGLADKMEEFIKTGRIKEYDRLKKLVPIELTNLMEIKGFGPHSLKKIHEELNIDSHQKIVEALQNGSIAKLKGFGKKKIGNMLRGLKLHKSVEDRMLLWDAIKLGDKLIGWIREIPGVVKAELAGSLRRKKETIGDFDILIACEEKDRKKVIDAFSTSDHVGSILLKGNTKVSVILKKSGKQIDFRIVDVDEWGAALQYFTGSKEHNIHIRKIAKEKGFKISEYGIFKKTTGEKIASRNEEEIYNTLSYQFMPPEMREDKGEIELAAKHEIPVLINKEDLKGDFHIHSLWSDGVNSIDEIVAFIKKSFNYEYIVLTDHSKSLKIANGLDEKHILNQIKAIEEINKKLGSNFVKYGVEVEILTDGKLDLPDHILSKLDWVTASIHTNVTQNITERLIKACENPYVNCLSHPTGRKIGLRESYVTEIEKIIESAKKTNTALEINGQPNRMDLNDDMAMLARKKGVKLVLGSDGHATSDFEYIQLSVFIAKRAWCKKEDILNTYSWDEIEKFTRLKRENNLVDKQEVVNA